MSIYHELQLREQENNPIKVGVIGAGQMGFGLITQISRIPGMIVGGVSDVNVERAQKAVDYYQSQENKKVNTLVSSDYREVIQSSNVEVIVDATGVPEVGANISLEALNSRKHLVLLNVEVDITIGSYMNSLFQSAGLVYSGSAGDEPAAIVELYEFAKTMGMEVVVAGKGKNNALKTTANPDTAAAEAKAKNMSPHMLAAFQDGTKTMAEMNLLSNAIGLVPDKVGMHGVDANLDDVAQKLDLKENGGVLNSLGVVEYVNGLAPGVFVIVKSDLEPVDEELRYLLKVDKSHGNHYTLYRPYHLASLETPVTIAKAVLHHDTSIHPLGAPISETVTVAKRDIKAGETLDGIGGYSVRGVLETHQDMEVNGHIPIGLISGNVVAKRDIKEGQFLTHDDVELDPSTTVWKLRALQDHMFRVK
ncbi:SAF domain-containing protein [Oceanobacillus profundus]|uniref:NAD(P)-dependent oxidoreductase n=1 Tax=Oceanobacillus profundus TaxID=372463 RepID=A0A417YPD8_9BACI|nr:SAF domain-containing protein [Oceanobacillus profundus]MBR3119340.1 NAD(P)-dependent oxidoreductase [Oceanobacillus sp.]PAE30428.1 NAD(P)-dependent oxidoreductase [Paenibacillus sp. 7884-2]MCM3400320.1 SAF domain-containing protein [Oceanobacillus profundus]MDO6451228.1 SAF domain-containing protein [Oceanobacillus profundus]RHW35557.1 NAD(P)-dependent oxidoreductase [Oceanobacillus profundus]